MPKVWTYPWHLASGGDNGGIETTVDRLAEHGVNGVHVASHYHSIRTFAPRDIDEGDGFTAYPGGCYFEPTPGAFDDTPIDPPVNEVPGLADPVAAVTDAAHEQGVAVNAWFVCFHNTALAASNPGFRASSVFGEDHEHALCPSNPEVRDYLAGVAGSLAAKGVDGIILESLGYQSAFHEHGETFGHTKDQVIGPAAGKEVLLSQCFCDACRTRARAEGVDVDAARELVSELAREAVRGPKWEAGTLATIRDDHPDLADLFAFRAAVIEDTVAGIADAVGPSVDLTYIVADGLGRGPRDGWPAGVDLARLEPYLDGVTALCYSGDPATAADRVRTLQQEVDIPVDAGITLDPGVVETESAWRAMLDAVLADDHGLASEGVTADDVVVYNESLLAEEHMEWLRRAFVADGLTEETTRPTAAGQDR